MRQLRPAFREGGTVTAGNSSPINDGAACLLLASEPNGRQPLARIVSTGAAGVDPAYMGIGPIPATRKLLHRTGLRMEDIDLFEVNEAFASVVLAWQRELEPDMKRVNVNGGAMALGHPVGSTGARLIASIINELERRDAELGLVTMCCGGGLGTGTILRRVG